MANRGHVTLSARLAIVAAALAGSSAVVGYETSTHEILSIMAARWSVLQSDPSLLSDLGLGTVDTLQFTDPRVALPQNAPAVIGSGAVLEDALSPILRSLNHFYDSQYNNYAGRGLNTLLLLGVPSPDWALEDFGQVLHNYGGPADRPQTWSYRHAQERYFGGLTGSSAANRQLAFSNMFLTLGYVIHHLQDMAQPQHVRNDPHPPGDGEFYPYEAYTKEREAEIWTLLQAQATKDLYPPAHLDDVRWYWATPNTGLVFRGMAEFTGQNYVSIDSLLKVVQPASGPPTISQNPDFPRPNGTNPDGTLKRIVTENITVRHRDGTVLNELSDYVVGDIVDGYYGRTAKDMPLMAFSVVPAQAAPFRAFTMTPGVFERNFGILLPRATAFSAGLIDHFFRGRVDLSRAPNGTDWVIRNSSPYPMNGVYSIYSENSSQVRSPVPGAQFSLNLAGGGTSTVTLTEPAYSTSKMVVAFQGQIGSEVPHDSGFRAVAGKVIPYTMPVIACQGKYTTAGSSSGLDVVRELGSTNATTALEFETYSIPDGLEVRSENAAHTLIKTTNGLVSGFRTLSFPFNPATLGSTRVRLQVTGNTDPGTVWTLNMGCPGQSLNNGDRMYPRVSVEFSFGGLAADTAGWCRADLWVDGAVVSQQITITTPSPGTQKRTITLTQGPAHDMEFKNYQCSTLPDAKGIFVGSSFKDPAGHTHTMQPMNLTGKRFFDVH